MIDIYSSDIHELWVKLSTHFVTEKKFFRYSLKDKKPYVFTVKIYH